jgi:hypothetical protein
MLVVIAVAVVLIHWRSRGGGAEQGIRTASIAFVPVLVAMEQDLEGAAHLGASELIVWILLLAVGVVSATGSARKQLIRFDLLHDTAIHVDPQGHRVARLPEPNGELGKRDLVVDR